MFSSSPEQIINQFNKSYFLIPFTKENAKAGKSYNVIDNIYAKKIDGDDNKYELNKIGGNLESIKDIKQKIIIDKVVDYNKSYVHTDKSEREYAYRIFRPDGTLESTASGDGLQSLSYKHGIKNYYIIKSKMIDKAKQTAADSISRVTKIFFNTNDETETDKESHPQTYGGKRKTRKANMKKKRSTKRSKRKTKKSKKSKTVRKRH